MKTINELANERLKALQESGEFDKSVAAKIYLNKLSYELGLNVSDFDDSKFATNQAKSIIRKYAKAFVNAETSTIEGIAKVQKKRLEGIQDKMGLSKTQSGIYLDIVDIYGSQINALNLGSEWTYELIGDLINDNNSANQIKERLSNSLDVIQARQEMGKALSKMEMEQIFFEFLG